MVPGSVLLGSGAAAGINPATGLPFVQALYTEQNAQGSTVQALVLTSTDIASAGGLGRTISVSVYKNSVTSTPICSGIQVAPGTPVTLSVGLSLAPGDVLLGVAVPVFAGAAQAAGTGCGGLVNCDVWGALNLDSVSQQVAATNLMLNQAFGTDIPSGDMVKGGASS